MEITKRWMSIRIEQDDARAMLYAEASDGSKTATGSQALELPKQLVKDLQAAIEEYGESADDAAMAALHQSRSIDRGDSPPDGVKAIKLDGGLWMKGETARRKD